MDKKANNFILKFLLFSFIFIKNDCTTMNKKEKKIFNLFLYY